MSTVNLIEIILNSYFKKLSFFNTGQINNTSQFWGPYSILG